MVTATKRQSKKNSLQDLLEAIRQLSPIEQRQLQDELARMVEVQLVYPDTAQDAIVRGRQMAETIQSELKKSLNGSLDELISSLRGRVWS